MIPSAFFWSGGKDSSFALHQILTEKKYDVKYLVTTVSKEFGRVSMHGVPVELVREQARAIGIPLMIMETGGSGNESYETAFLQVISELKSGGICSMIFGDIFLEDLKEYRDKLLEKAGCKGVYPIWKTKTEIISEQFVSKGFKAVICSVDSGKLDKNFPGKIYGFEMIRSLPAGIDICGENGEFHTFVFDGPFFSYPVNFRRGEVVHKEFPLGKGLPSQGYFFLEMFVD